MSHDALVWVATDQRGSQCHGVGCDSAVRVTACRRESWHSGVGHSTAAWVTAQRCGSRHSSVGHSTAVWVTTQRCGSRHSSVGHDTAVWVTTQQCGSRHCSVGRDSLRWVAPPRVCVTLTPGWAAQPYTRPPRIPTPPRSVPVRRPQGRRPRRFLFGAVSGVFMIIVVYPSPPPRSRSAGRHGPWLLSPAVPWDGGGDAPHHSGPPTSPPLTKTDIFFLLQNIFYC